MSNELDRRETWSESDSDDFIDYGAYFVPEREVQIDTICSLIPEPDASAHIVELCCGEGLLAAALARQFPTATVHGLDGSTNMLEASARRLEPFGERSDTRRFDLAATEWRRFPGPCMRWCRPWQCIISTDRESASYLPT